MPIQKKNIYTLLTDITIIGIAIIISIILIVQYNTVTSVTIDNREDRYFRPVNPQQDIIRGNPNADIFVVEYGDLECPYCKDFHSQIKTIIKSDWGKSGKVAWVWRNGFHVNETSEKKAQTLECVRRYAGERSHQKTWDFIEESLIGGVEEIDYPFDRYKDIMEHLDIPFERVEECRKNNEVAAEMEESRKDIRELNISRTPYLQFISNDNELLYESVGSITTAQLEIIIAHIFRRGQSEKDEK